MSVSLCLGAYVWESMFGSLCEPAVGLCLGAYVKEHVSRGTFSDVTVQYSVWFSYLFIWKAYIFDTLNDRYRQTKFSSRSDLR